MVRTSLLPQSRRSLEDIGYFSFTSHINDLVKAITGVPPLTTLEYLIWLRDMRDSVTEREVLYRLRDK